MALRTRLIRLLLACLFAAALFVAPATATVNATWFKHAHMLMARSDIMIVSDNEYAYAAGGCVSAFQGVCATCGCANVTDLFTRYSFAADAWTVLPRMPRPRFRYASALVGGAIFFIGGRNVDDGFIEEIDVYSIRSQEWSQLPAQNGMTRRSDFACWPLAAKIYCTGGFDALYSTAYNSTIVLDLNSATKVFQAGVVADRKVASGDCRSLLLDGKVYVFGGFTAANPPVALASLEMYDPILNTWTTKAPMRVARGNPAKAVVGGFLLAIGGETKDANGVSVPIDSIEFYDPTLNAWCAETAKLALPRFRFSVGQSANKIYDIGGQGAAVNSPIGTAFPILADVYSLDVCALLRTANASSKAVPPPVCLPPAPRPNSVRATTTAASLFMGALLLLLSSLLVSA